MIHRSSSAIQNDLRRDLSHLEL